MVRTAGLILLATAITAWADEVPSTPATVSMVAVRAADEAEPYFDPALNAVRSALADVKSNALRKVRASDTSAPYAEETKFPIDERYTLYITPVSRGDDGRVRAKARITVVPRRGGSPVNAVDTTLSIVPGDYVKIRGLKIESGELVVLLTVKK